MPAIHLAEGSVGAGIPLLGEWDRNITPWLESIREFFNGMVQSRYKVVNKQKV